MNKREKSGLRGKEAADDVPSWAQGEQPLTTESGRDFAELLLNVEVRRGELSDRAG
jgi:hypothetical protein